MTTAPDHDVPEQQDRGYGTARQEGAGRGPTPPLPPPYYYRQYQQPPNKKHRVRNSLLIGGAALVVSLGIIIGILAAIGNNVNNAVNPNHVATSAPAFGSASTPTPSPTGPAMLSQGEPAQIAQNGSNAATVTVASVRTSTTPADQFGSNRSMDTL